MEKVKTDEPTKPQPPNKHSPPSPAELYIWKEGTSVYVKRHVGNLKRFCACDLKTKHHFEMY